MIILIKGRSKLMEPWRRTPGGKGRSMLKQQDYLRQILIVEFTKDSY